MHVLRCVFVCVYLYVCICMRVFVCVYLDVCGLCVYLNVCICMCVTVCICMCVTMCVTVCVTARLCVWFVLVQGVEGYRIHPRARGVGQVHHHARRE